MMKKLLFFAAALVMAACGNKTQMEKYIQK